MTTQPASLGRIVLFRMSQHLADQANKRRTDFLRAHPQESGLQAHVGNEVLAGRVYPATIVSIHSPTLVNLQVTLDGTDTLWATSVDIAPEGQPDKPYAWIWPPRV